MTPAAPEEQTEPAKQEPIDRLRSGELRTRVLEDLKHRSEPVTPSAIAKVLGRSGGAVSNALERLVTEGLIERVNERPRRYVVAKS